MAAILTVVLATTLGITAVSPEAPLAAQIQAASVRLAVADGRGIDYGSGTIVGVYGKRRLIVHLRHVFEHAGPGASVAVILLSSGSEERLPGRVISFDKENDVGLVSVDGLSGADAAGLAAPQYELRPGDRVVVAGCEGGRQWSSLPTSSRAWIALPAGPTSRWRPCRPTGAAGAGFSTTAANWSPCATAGSRSAGQGVYAALPCILQEMKKNGITSVRDYLAQRIRRHGGFARPLQPRKPNGLIRRPLQRRSTSTLRHRCGIPAGIVRSPQRTSASRAWRWSASCDRPTRRHGQAA